MQLLVVVFCLIIFFYSLYILGKDDHVFIRKNLSLEQLFDIAFIGIFTGIILANILSFVFPTVKDMNIVVRLFSPTGAGFSLISIILGYMLVLFLIGKYRKLPIARLSDFFSLALLSALPVGYFLSILFIKRSDIIYYIIPGIIYLVSQVFFWRFLLERVISGKLRDGSLCSFFLVVFSVVSFFVHLFYKFTHAIKQIKVDEFILIGIFLCGLLFLLYTNRGQILRRRFNKT
ncbi:hypothetical protein KJ980_00030 [Patescibacteria group bacterium]|nr:hypothetical protein [Patescibacteria group bacterium]MBU4017135.1 hypothetical protein [Patescibacteria group bacterium]MBU4098016.1 hypothetical protein [Patescibacteria group bacterium]